MIIETERLLLRPFQEGDEEDVFEYLNEPAVNCFASMKLHSLEEAREEVLKRSSETEYYFAIVLKESGKVIGEIDAYPEPADVHGADSEMDTFSPCWMLNRAYHGRGMHMRQPMLSLIIFSRIKEQGEYMPIQRIITRPASIFARN